MNNYEVVIKREELLGILSNYYSKKYNKKVTIIDQIDKKYYGYYDDVVLSAKMYYEETIELLGHKATKKAEITDEEVKEILNELIDENYEIDYLIRNIENRTTGYYMDEHTEPTFTGIKLSIREKQRKMVLK